MMKKVSHLKRREVLASGISALILYVSSASARAQDCLTDVSANSVCDFDPDFGDPAFDNEPPQPVTVLPFAGVAVLAGLLGLLGLRASKRRDEK